MHRTNPVELVLASRYGADCRSRVQPLLSNWYRETADVLWRTITTMTGATGTAPRIEVVHSPHSFPQLLGIQGGTVLVYDQHLGQMFARLTRITADSAPPSTVDAYLAKIAAIRALARGNWKAASALTIASAHFHEQTNATAEASGNTGIEARHVLVNGQEAFVLGHELAHHLKYTEPEQFESFGEDVAMILESWAARRQTSKYNAVYVADEMTRAAITAWERRHGPLDNDQTQAIQSAFQNDPDTIGAADDAHKTLETFQSDAALREEAICDVLAGLAAVPIALRNGATIEQAIEGTAYAMHHLRLVQSLHAVADDVPPSELAAGVVGSATRLTILRPCLGVLLETLFPDQLSADRCHNLVTGVNLRHAEVIGDQLWLMTSEMLRNVVANNSDQDPAPETIRAALGFGSEPTTGSGVP